MKHELNNFQFITYECNLCGKKGVGGYDALAAHLATCRFSRGGYMPRKPHQHAPYIRWLSENAKVNQQDEPTDPLDKQVRLVIDLTKVINFVKKLWRKR